MHCFPNVENLHHKWGWILLLGIVLICLGAGALVMTPVSTVAAVLVLGWVVVASGVMEIVHAFRVPPLGRNVPALDGRICGYSGWPARRHAPDCRRSCLDTAVCFLLLRHRDHSTLLAALRLKFANWGWAVFDGVITLGLGILVWAHWPWSGLWFLGISLGVTLLLRGWSYVMLAFAVRNIPTADRMLRAA